jgi:NADPH:quinone reductase-like Zn-dependent oxidoreductase
MREWSACVDVEAWQEILLRTGFSGLDIVLDDYEDPVCHEMSLIISTATTTHPATQTTLPKTFSNAQIVLVVEDESHFQTALAAQIKDRIDESLVTIVTLLDLPNLDYGSKACFVFLPEVEKSLLSGLQAPKFEALKASMSSVDKLLWVTRGGGNLPESPDYGIIDGLARVLRTEHGEHQIVVLALELKESSCSQSQIDNIIRLLHNIMETESSESYEPEYREVDGMLHISRAVEEKDLDKILEASPNQSKVQPFGNEPALALTIGFPGLLDTLKFVRDDEYYLPLKANEIEIEVKAVGLNFLDVLIALGRVNLCTIGAECAGIVTRVGSNCVLTFQPGDHVLACAGSFRTFARVTSNCAVVIPVDIPFTEAAALPINFTTAWHALHEVARILPGESILIHFGAGGTGQAAIQIAQHAGAEVYTTVGSKEKKQFLVDQYQVPEDHIFYSRDNSFAQGIKSMTDGRGVDVVLNSLAGEGLVASWEIIAPYGRFIEIGKKDIWSRRKLPMFPFAANVSFCAIDLASMVVHRPSLVQRSFQRWVSLYLDGTFRAPQPLNCYTLSDIEDAFRYLQSGKSIGKIVVEVKREDPVMVSDKDPSLPTHFETDNPLDGRSEQVLQSVCWNIRNIWWAGWNWEGDC